MHHIAEAVASDRATLIANHNAHSIYLTKRIPELGEFFERADLIEVDSTPLIFFTRVLGLHSRAFHRCTYLDWRDHFWSVASRNSWRVFYLGGAPGVAALAAERLSARYPGVAISTRDGFFDMDSSANDQVLAEIATACPQILFVGMGMPRQELWIHRNRDLLPPMAVLSVGAAFDYEADVQCPAPRWMGIVGIEWLFRLAGDPHRLFYRYCVEPWSLLLPAAQDIAAALIDRRLLRDTAGNRKAAADKCGA
ncbi:MAG: WecB/TagA/CpsF family glycosyltransferase [Pseudomonadota bacterium]|uniref:WecB/TagA/CpsF family glycosyltransferase n=1 Tax=Phenylobacterium sp. TaxID=1871053 RepID=UPI0025F3F276|nr:WecB/TagA/CpsF family glycosyltransferase [Phenylobacterium sp.]